MRTGFPMHHPEGRLGARLASAKDHNKTGYSVLKLSKRLLCSSKPVMVVTALVAVLGITGTAYGAKLITGLDIRDGSITAVDLSKSTQASLKGDKGSTGAKGVKGNLGVTGNAGAAGGLGPTGAKGDTGVGVAGRRAQPPRLQARSV